MSIICQILPDWRRIATHSTVHSFVVAKSVAQWTPRCVEEPRMQSQAKQEDESILVKRVA